MIGMEDIEAARRRIAPYVRRTPVTEAALARAALPVSGKVAFKLEQLQVTGFLNRRPDVEFVQLDVTFENGGVVV